MNILYWKNFSLWNTYVQIKELSSPEMNIYTCIFISYTLSNQGTILSGNAILIAVINNIMRQKERERMQIRVIYCIHTVDNNTDNNNKQLLLIMKNRRKLPYYIPLHGRYAGIIIMNV